MGMETLRHYLNSLPADEQHRYASRCQTTVGYLRKAISKRHRLDGALARMLDDESGHAVNKAELRPDIWPELMDTVQAINEPSHA